MYSPVAALRRAASGFDRVAVVSASSASSDWRIVLANGVELEFSGSVDEATLSTVLGVASRL
ncbi:MAG: hypothetical protein M5U09_01455 [Gammaproteobacteria bacterium]|nr:hypothetical protein [Gammaproteobacteria bacterium]